MCVSTGCACTAVNQHDDSSIHSFVSKMSENSQNIVIFNHSVFLAANIQYQQQMTLMSWMKRQKGEVSRLIQ